MILPEIIQRLRKRDQQALSVLYDRYADPLMGLIYRILGNRAVAEEVLQQTMMKVWNNIDSYDEGKASLFTWISTIARNSALDKRRLKSFQNQEQKTDSIDTTVVTERASQTDTSNIDVEKLTAKMDAKYKEVLDHIYLLGYSHQETSEILSIPLGTVKTRLRFAINALREELKNERGLFLGLLIISLILMLIL